MIAVVFAVRIVTVDFDQQTRPVFAKCREGSLQDTHLGAFDVDTGPLPSVDDDPAGAWSVVRDAIQRSLDDPAIAERVEDCGPPGHLSLAAAVEMACTPDVLVHTWDLARAVGLDERLDPGEVHRMAEGLLGVPPEVDQAMRSSGHYGPRVEVPAGADEQTRLLAFMGRRA